ncbi:HK97-gp10 family putative phage morphogenesis protein [Stutzerimonas stutzeri]|uniref:HK97-gp10 family putative phage morphogenesis protein n=1 Tax=Stutzerimonas stutzeri TaxID=316 RepID=UPI00210DCAD4|nr:HK97-gp10 family putative phage morphogenesis protein [Stutzerimonas stutzeri]MCQ4257472.1 HK97 gp10 family phage protein [Stutzerimonas stutzeri]
MDISLDIIGLEALGADFLQLGDAMQRKIARPAVLAGARIGRDALREAAPVRTGKLKRSAVATVARRSDTPGEVVAGVRISAPRGDSQAAFYWKFIELGTRHMPPAPFIRPSWDGALQKIEGAVINRLAEGIDKAITGL